MGLDNLVGQTLGQYQVLEKIGEGGMAAVYRAWQPSLQRYVALKVLHPYLLKDAEFVERFKQEAIIAANLRHHNIVTIYEVGQDKGRIFIAMEFIEGRSLGEIIASEGAMALDRAIDVVAQVASALDYAHKHGVIHRDIKPANILLTNEGRAVITDFGIAKALTESGFMPKLTQVGTVLGTPAYMSPEQIQGQVLDYRSDLYSLGIVVYEMLSGRTPFGGATTALLYAQVNLVPPDIRALNPQLPAHVSSALSVMLAKNPSDRFPSATAFVQALKGEESFVSPAPLPKGKTVVMPPGMETTLPPYPPHPPFPPPPSQGGPVSPPGVYPPKETKSAWLRTAGIGFGCLAVAGIMVVAMIALMYLFNMPPGIQRYAQGLFQQATVTPSPVSAGRVIAFISERDGNTDIYLTRADGSGLVNLTNSAANEYFPRWSPDGAQISCHVYSPGVQAGQGDAKIHLINVATGESALVNTGFANSKFASWSPDGSQLVFSGQDGGSFDLFIIDLRTGNVRRITEGPEDDYFPSWSPDGKGIAFVRVDGAEREIFKVDLDTLEAVNLTNRAGEDSWPDWSPDGRSIAFASNRTGNLEIYVMNADGSGQRQLTNTTGYNNREPFWTADGNHIVFGSNRDGNWEIYIMNANGSNPIRLTSNSVPDYNPSCVRIP